MKKIKELLLNKFNLENERGAAMTMVVAIIVVGVTLASSVSLVELIRSDSLLLEYQQDAVQQELLLRSEAGRTHIAVEYSEHRPLPNRTVEIINGNNERVTTYKINNSKENIIVSNFMGYAAKQVVSVRSHITARRGRSYSPSYKSPVERLSEKLMQHESLAEFQYFTDTEESENADGGQEAAAVKFWGQDVLYGKVHSNDDIWIQNAGGGETGWPTFYETVTTSGIFRRYPSGEPLIGSGAPIEEIFRKDFAEEVAPITFSATMDDILANGTQLMPPINDVAYVTLNGSTYEVEIGDIQLVDVKQFEVYSWHPLDAVQAAQTIFDGGNWFEDSDLIYTNSLAIFDTVWSNNSGFVDDNSVLCPGKLFIKGEVAGKQTWGATDTVYTVGNITYANTEIGDHPDGFTGISDDGEAEYDLNAVNQSDFFGLVSEEKILISYKFRKENMGDVDFQDNNSQGITLYGAYAAIGEGDVDVYGEMACHHDGIFTFQYHHPAGSTPNFWGVSPYLMEEFTLKMYDSEGNGWEGATLELYKNDELLEDDLYCDDDETEFTFNLENGDILEVHYLPGAAGSAEEHSYEIFDEDDALVVGDGPSPGAGVAFQAFVEFDFENPDTLYQYVDLHRYIYPPDPFLPEEERKFNMQSNGYPHGYPFNLVGFPYDSSQAPGAYANAFPNNGPSYVGPDGTDWPWYNPVWPESAETVANNMWFEGRYATIYGAIAQRRRGFMRRSGTDPYNHPTPANTDPDLYHYGREHNPTGFDKEYYYDRRFLFEQPPDYPQIYRGWGTNDVTSFTEQTWYFRNVGN
jgi:hypothetical protein